MPVKLYKKEETEKLEVGQILYSKRFNLTVDRKKCKGCDVCQVVCPREAITLKPLPRDEIGKARAPVVDVVVEKCDFHAICGATCPFGAISVTVNNETHNPVVEKECYPMLERRITINSDGCDPECKACEEKCPLKVISVRFEPITAEQAIVKGIKVAEGKSPMRTIVDVDKEHCACCKVCEAACPAKVITVEKFFNGNIQINAEKCPEGCKDCFDVCPVEALYVENGKVHTKEEFCIYCKACLNVCPRPEALHIQRTSVRHTPVKSGAWNKSLEKLTSVKGIKREFMAKRLMKAKEAIKNLPMQA